MSFADGSERWRRVGRRFAACARETGWFTGVDVFDAARLGREWPEFFASRPSIVDPPALGFGYWTWKPFLLSRLIESGTVEAEVVAYIDAGCHLNVTLEATNRMIGYVEQTVAQGVLLMQMHHLPEREWTKPSVLDYFELPAEARRSGQIMGTLLMLRNDDVGAEFARAWDTAALVDNCRLLTDPAATDEAGQHLVAHRYDQSILSCLAKSRGLFTVPEQTYFAPDWARAGRTYPIWAVRNRSGVRFSTHAGWFKAKRIGERAYLAARGTR